MIDAFTLFMALTLVVAGLFLCRDYARFLRSSYCMPGRVTSIQHVFFSRLSGAESQLTEAYVENGFYPVIEYASPEGPVSFTAIDQDASGRFHVGDEVRLRVSKTRRRENRICKTALILAVMLIAMGTALMLDMVFSNVHLSAQSVFLASGVMATCLAILVAYVKDRDEYCSYAATRTAGGKTQLCLFEPTAFQKWALVSRDPRQRSKIRTKQFFGATCVCSAMLMVAMTV